MRATSLPAERPHVGFLFGGFLTFLGGAYIDNIKNALFPIFTRELHLSMDQAGLFLTLGSVGSFVCTYLIGWALRYRSERSVTFFSCLLAICVTGFALFVKDPKSLFILAALMGGIGATMGTLTNILTMRGSTPSVKGKVLTYTQMLGTIAAMAGPFLVGALGSAKINWANLLIMSAPFFAVMACYALKVFPSKKAQMRATTPHADAPPMREPRQALTRSHLFVIGIFCLFVAAEGLSTSWMVLYSQKAFNYSTGKASQLLFGFLLVVAGTRFFSGTFVRPKYENHVLILSLVLATIFSLLGMSGHAIGLSLIGLSGPFFPLFLGRICNRFHTSWKQMTVYVFLAMQIFIALCHYVVGAFAQKWGIHRVFGIVPFLFGLTLVLMIVYLARERRLAPAPARVE